MTDHKLEAWVDTHDRYYVRCCCGRTVDENMQLVDALTLERHGVCPTLGEDNTPPERTAMQEAFDRATEL